MGRILRLWVGRALSGALDVRYNFDKLSSAKRHATRCKDAQWCIEAPSEILQKHIGILHLT